MGFIRSTDRYSVFMDGVTRQVAKEETSGINRINTKKLQSVVMPHILSQILRRGGYE